MKKQFRKISSHRNLCEVGLIGPRWPPGAAYVDYVDSLIVGDRVELFEWFFFRESKRLDQKLKVCVNTGEGERRVVDCWKLFLFFFFFCEVCFWPFKSVVVLFFYYFTWKRVAGQSMERENGAILRRAHTHKYKYKNTSRGRGRRWRSIYIMFGRRRQQHKCRLKPDLGRVVGWLVGGGCDWLDSRLSHRLLGRQSVS